MTEAIAAIASSNTPNPEQISLNDLAEFENAYDGEEIQFSSINSINETKAIEPSDRLFQYVMEIDEGYHNIFSQKIDVSADTNSLQNQNNGTESLESSFKDGSLEGMMISYHEASYLRLEAMAWSLRLQLLLTSATTMTKGLGSLLKG
jgi:hypothetical protein